MKHTFSVQKLLIENNVVSELMWKNILEAGRPRVTKQRMHVAFWMHKTTATHSDISCFRIGTMSAGTSLNVTLNVQWLSCWYCSFYGTTRKLCFSYPMLSTNVVVRRVIIMHWILATILKNAPIIHMRSMIVSEHYCCEVLFTYYFVFIDFCSHNFTVGERN